VHPALDEERARLETELRARYAGLTRAELRTTGHLAANDAYYRRFGQTYHVLMQIESIVLKGKPIPRRAALVEAAFMAELATGILTASHDLDALAPPVTVDVATGEETYVLYSGADQTCKVGDMFMRDRSGILTSVVAGPPRYARVTPVTTAALFCVYAPPGIGETAVRAHLAAIEANVCLFAPGAETVATSTIAAGG
jgi:DNA/RNA-binding domain of Phe-tRNA-synthetase-like protein